MKIEFYFVSEKIRSSLLNISIFDDQETLSCEATRYPLPFHEDPSKTVRNLSQFRWKRKYIYNTSVIVSLFPEYLRRQEVIQGKKFI